MKQKLLLILLFLPLLLSAEMMYLRMSNGDTVEYAIEHIVEITFSDLSEGDFENLPDIAIISSLSNHPNPFNPQTTIKFDLSKQGQTTVDIYNVKGQRVVRILDGYLPQGTHTVNWMGRNEKGSPVATGVYFLSVKSRGEQIIRKMMLLK